MGNIGSRLSRPFKNWNIESRAHKVITKEKPQAAPTFPSTLKQIDLVNKLEPDYKEVSQRKDQQLDQHLKNVYVRSNDRGVKEIDTRSDPNRPLPIDKFIPEPFEYGFYESDEVTPGRISLRQAIEFMNNHAKDPEKYTVEFIAEKHKLDQKVVENILEYYKIYEVINYELFNDNDIVARPLPISIKSGITVLHTINKKKKDDSENIKSKNKQIKEGKIGQIEAK